MTVTVTNPAANPGNLTGVGLGDGYVGTLQQRGGSRGLCVLARGDATLTGGASGGTTVGFNAGTILPGGTCTRLPKRHGDEHQYQYHRRRRGHRPGSSYRPDRQRHPHGGSGSPRTVTKAFAVGSLASGGNTSLTVTVGNTNNSSAITLAGALTDTFPASVAVDTAGDSGTCAGVTHASGNFTMANGTSIPAGGCTIMVIHEQQRRSVSEHHRRRGPADRGRQQCRRGHRYP